MKAVVPGLEDHTKGQKKRSLNFDQRKQSNLLMRSLQLLFFNWSDNLAVGGFSWKQLWGVLLIKTVISKLVFLIP